MCILEFDETQHWLSTVWFHLSSTPPEVWAPTSRRRGNCRAAGLSLPTSHTDQERSLHPRISESRAFLEGPHSLPRWMLNPHQQFSSESSLPAWWRRQASEIRGTQKEPRFPPPLIEMRVDSPASSGKESRRCRCPSRGSQSHLETRVHSRQSCLNSKRPRFPHPLQIRLIPLH